MLSNLKDAEKTQEEADTAKRVAHDALDTHMGATLSKHQSCINVLLGKSGPLFKITKSLLTIAAAPRSEYGMELRGRSVPIKGEPPFLRTALSEGDKRTLAFTFYTVLIREDAALNTIVVIDDPMCRLDLNCKHVCEESRRHGWHWALESPCRCA